MMNVNFHFGKLKYTHVMCMVLFIYAAHYLNDK